MRSQRLWRCASCSGSSRPLEGAGAGGPWDSSGTGAALSGSCAAATGEAAGLVAAGTSSCAGSGLAEGADAGGGVGSATVAQPAAKSARIREHVVSARGTGLRIRRGSSIRAWRSATGPVSPGRARRQCRHGRRDGGSLEWRRDPVAGDPVPSAPARRLPGPPPRRARRHATSRGSCRRRRAALRDS